ncbi:MAG: T9SS type A sorting domain-containing protein [Chitinophagaceae bacterium]
MKKWILALSAISISLLTFAHGDHALPGDANPNITPYRSAVESRNGVSKAKWYQSTAWQSFVQKYPGWGTQMNTYNGMPRRAVGNPIDINGGGNDAVQKAMYFLQTELSAYKIPANELQLTRQYNDGKFIHVDFKQVHQNMDVCWSRIAFRFTQDLKLVMFGLDAHADLPNVSATLTPALAEQKARQAITTSITGSRVETALKIFPLPQDGRYVYRPVYTVWVETQDDQVTPGNYMSLVDAQTGVVLYRQNKVVHIGLQAKANVHATNLFTPTTNLPLRNLSFTVNGTTYYTDTAGNATVPGAGPINAVFSLGGRYIRTVTGANGTTTATQTTNGINNNDVVNFTAVEPNASVRHLTAYYHGDLVHGFMKSKLPNFTTMDNPLLTRIDRTDGNCNAFYNGSSINFYTTANGCNALSVVNTVVYHEYAHGITNQFWASQSASFDNGAVGEGYSDIWSISITKDPIVGQGFYVNQPSSFIRRYDINPKVYPQDLVGQVHADGEIIAGCWWDYAINLSATMPLSTAVDTMANLFSRSHYGLANGPDGTEGQVYFDILIDALQYDDTDNNINNGTPHFMAIVQAFAKHGIYLLSDAEINHAPPGVVASGASVNMDATAIVGFPAFLGDVKIFYRVKGATLVDSILMAKSGTNFNATFPSSNPGTIYEYYFVVYDNTNFPSAVSPFDAKFNITLSQRNIPHYLLVGYQSAKLENFENITASTPGWTVGNVAGDNATGGKWISAVPISSATQGDTVQTGKDHTGNPVPGKCAVTANGSLPTSAIGSADVDGGRTSLITEEYDLTPYNKPIISYWRWFTNSQGTNPRKDWWRVYCSYNNGGSWTLIERTFAPDVSWRRYVWEPNLANGNKVRLMFVATDSAQGAATGSIVEAAVDDFEILELAWASNVNDVNALPSYVYPNPANNSWAIVSAVSGELRYTVRNTLGQIVLDEKQMAISGQPIQVNAGHWANGLYYIELASGDKKTMHKLMIQH